MINMEVVELPNDFSLPKIIHKGEAQSSPCISNTGVAFNLPGILYKLKINPSSVVTLCVSA